VTHVKVLTYPENLVLEAYFLTIRVLESLARRPQGPTGLGIEMKTKNQTEHALLELAVAKAANEDGFGSLRDAKSSPKQAWSPLEVWRTRVKTPSRTNPADTVQI
jgi:hypothetical protein